MFRVSSLGSGSKGNATVIQYQQTRLLVDSGFSCKELELRLAKRELEANQIDAILVTHEHSDHLNGVATLSNRYQIPVWMSHGTSMAKRAEKIKQLNCFNSHQSFQLGDIEVSPVLVPHDAREACQYVFTAGSQKVGILTDLGHITPYVSQHYCDCDILLLEFNHDREMLAEGRYPSSLKARVGGSLGHLNNDQASEFLQATQSKQLKYLVAMHLSEENNCVKRVAASIYSADICTETKIFLADQATGFDWLNLEN